MLNSNQNNENNNKVYFINEYLASNSTILADEYGEYDDWVEIYNNSENTVDIGGMFICGDPEDSIPFQIPETDPQMTSIAPRGFILLWFDRDSEQGVLHIENKLSKDGYGESIILIDRDGKTIIDSVALTPQNTDVSYGRFPDGSDYWITFNKPTPGTSNHLNHN
jgi:hypothetical protein